MKCHLYTSRFLCLANIFSRSRQFDDKCIAGFVVYSFRFHGVANRKFQNFVIYLVYPPIVKLNSLLGRPKEQKHLSEDSNLPALLKGLQNFEFL